MTKYFLLLSLWLSGVNLFSQEEKNEFLQPDKVEVEITNFVFNPADCGYQNTVSLYKAKVLDFNKYTLGEEIIIYVICKKEKYSKELVGARFNVEIRETTILPNSSTYNFTGFNEEELAEKRKYEIVSLKVLTED